jgi:hypothetical protein
MLERWAETLWIYLLALPYECYGLGRLCTVRAQVLHYCISLCCTIPSLTANPVADWAGVRFPRLALYQKLLIHSSETSRRC